MAARASWGAITQLCTELAEQMDEIAPAITARIRSEEPLYAAVALSEHETHVREQQVRLLRAIAEGREPDEDDLQRASLLGRRRAQQELPVHVVIGAYHVGNRELWDRLRAVPGVHSDLLPDVAALMWASVQRITSTLAAAHAEVTRAQQADQITLRHRLVSLLQLETVDEESLQIARTLGFDVDGTFTAIIFAASGSDGDGLSALRTALDAVPGTVITARSREWVVVIAQVTDVDALLAVATRAEPRTSFGVGLDRTGVTGAAQSLHDAHRVLAGAPPGKYGVQRFGDAWLRSVLVADESALRELIMEQLPVVRANPHLADAVIAFAEQDLSATGAARALGLHPNTAMYRLSRWHELTGWDPKTFAGLSISLLACWLSGVTERGTPRD